MAAPDPYRLLLQPLHSTGIEYMITGSVAAIVYGEPRMTNDVDLVVRLDLKAAVLLERAFPEESYYVPPREVIDEERQRPQFGHFNIIHRDTALRADFYVASDVLHAWAFDRRRSENIAGSTVWFAPVEYVIVRKLEYYRESGSDRHLRDIAGIVRVSRATINDEALRGLLEQRRLVEFWERAVAS